MLPPALQSASWRVERGSSTLAAALGKEKLSLADHAGLGDPASECVRDFAAFGQCVAYFGGGFASDREIAGRSDAGDGLGGERARQFDVPEGSVTLEFEVGGKDREG